MAEDDLRQVSLLAAVTNQEAYTEAVKRLKNQVGEIIVVDETRHEMVLTADGYDPEFDRAGYAALRAKFGK